MWPDQRILDLLGIELPIIQAPMAGSVSSEMVIAVSEAGGLGSLPCAMLAPDQARTELGHHPPANVAANQPQFFLPATASGRSGTRGRLETSSGAVLRRARARPAGTQPWRDPRTLR